MPNVPRSSPAHQVPHDQAADGTDGEAVKEQPRECAEAQNKHREHAKIALHRSPAAMLPKSRATLHPHGERVKTAPGTGRRAAPPEDGVAARFSLREKALADVARLTVPLAVVASAAGRVAPPFDAGRRSRSGC